MLEEYLQWKPFFEIVPLENLDCREISELHGQRFPRQWNDGEFLGLLLQPNVFGFIARQTNAFFSRPAAGFVLARETAGEAEILTIAVAERFAGAGLGWRLMQAALREAEQRGAEEIFLEVEAANEPAVRLYRKLDFVTVAERPAYYESAGGERSSALVMKRDLR